MTPNILQSDIELAKRLLEARRPEGEIVVALTRRGVSAAKAAGLVADLRRGKMVAPEMAVVRRSAPGPGPEVPEVHRDKGLGGQAPSPPGGSRGSETRRDDAEKPSGTGRRWGLAIVLVILVAAGGVVAGHFLYPGGIKALWDRLASTGPATQPSRKATSPLLDGRPKPLPAGSEWELGEDGLHLAGTLVTRENARNALSQILGPPTRTNQVEEASKVIYAFDVHGLLVYSQSGTGADSIVFDFEALGGEHGTTSPFAGTLKIQDAVIRSDTDAQTLATIKTLALTRSGSDGGIFGGPYHKVGLCFAYRSGLQSLRSIEIDLK